MLSSIILDSNKSVTNWMSTRISSEKLKPYDTNLDPTTSNLANGRVTLKFNNFILVQKISSSLYSNFISNVYIIYELTLILGGGDGTRVILSSPMLVFP